MSNEGWDFVSSMFFQLLMVRDAPVGVVTEPHVREE